MWEVEMLQAVTALPGTFSIYDFLSMFGGEKQHFRVFSDTESDRAVFDKMALLSDVSDVLTRYNNKENGIFFVVNETDGIKARDKNIVEIRAVFLDLDGAPIQPVLDEAKIEPHIIVESSPGKYHIYWLVNGVDIDLFKPIQTALAKRFKGDKSVNNPSRVLRLPGFYHCKTSQRFMTNVTHLKEDLPHYTVDEIISGLGLDISEICQPDKRFILSETVPGGERNVTMFRFACSLRANGVSIDEIQDKVEQANNEKCSPSLSIREIQKIVDSVKKYPEGRSKKVDKKELSAGPGLELGKHFFPDFWANEILKNHRMFYDNEFFLFDGKYYPKQEDDTIEAIIRLMGKGLLRAKHVDEIIRSLRVAIKRNGQPERDPKELLCLENCLLNCIRGVGLPHTDKEFITYKIGIRYDKDAKCPLWLKTLEEILPDPKTRVLLQKYAGYTLTPDVTHQKALYMYGLGANGKSVIIDVMQSLLGSSNYVTMELEALGDKFMVHAIQGKLANFSSEVEAGKVRNDALFKKLVDGSELTVDKKYVANPISFRPFAKLWVAANHLFDTKDTSYGIMRRLLFLHFDKKMDDTNRDLNRAKRIIDTEMSGVLNWGLEGLRLLSKEGFDPLPVCHNQLYKETISAIDPRSDFVENHLDVAPGSGEYLKDIFQSWKDYAEGYGRKVGSDKALKRAIQQYRPNVEFVNYSHKVYIKGVKLVNNDHDDIPF
jgi:putative DNA primase/helicase